MHQINKMELEHRIETMESKLEETHALVKELEDKQEENLVLVKEIHAIVIGTEYNRNDSMLVKLNKLQQEVDTLKTDKIKREANVKVYMALAGFVGTLIGGILIAIFNNYLTKK